MTNACLKASLIVKNCPVSIIGNDDNVMVARLADSELWYYGMYATLERAEEVAKELGNAVVFEVDTKNDLPHCQHTDAEIAKSFIGDVEAVKDQLPCGEQMDFPDTFDEFAKDYGFRDKDEIYTNGSELIPVFRVKQWLEHILTTKNDLGVDCISRADAIKAMQNKAKKLTNEDIINGLCGAVAILYNLPSVTPQEPKKGHWIDTHEYHYYNDGDIETTELRCSCCNEVVEWDIELLHKPYFCENCGADMREVEE